MLSDSAMKWLQSLGAEKPSADQPWSAMLGQNYSSVPADYQAPAEPNASFDPSVMASMLQAAQPPMNQPEVKADPTPDPLGGSQSMGGTYYDPEMKALYKKLQDKAQESIGYQKQNVNALKEDRAKLAGKQLDPNFEALMALSDAWGNTNLQKQYKAPMSEDERQALLRQADTGILNQLGNISKEELSALKTQQEGMLLSQKYKEGQATKLSDQDEKDRETLRKAMDTEKSSGRFTPIGKAQTNVYQAQRIQALIDQYAKDPNSMPLTGPASLSEVAIGLNSLLSATGGSEESRKSLIPSSVRGKYSTLEQFLTNEPVGANMAEFVKNATDTLKRERETNQGQVDAYHKKMNDVYGLGRFAKRHPEEFTKMMSFYTSQPDAAAPGSAASAAPAESAVQSFPPDWSPEKIAKYKRLKGIQ